MFSAGVWVCQKKGLIRCVFAGTLKVNVQMKREYTHVPTILHPEIYQCEQCKHL